MEAYSKVKSEEKKRGSPCKSRWWYHLCINYDRSQRHTLEHHHCPCKSILGSREDAASSRYMRWYVIHIAFYIKPGVSQVTLQAPEMQSLIQRKIIPVIARLRKLFPLSMPNVLNSIYLQLDCMCIRDSDCFIDSIPIK
jgi:hypothetical protein